MDTPSKQLQHPSRMRSISRLAENVSHAFSDRIASDHISLIDLAGDVGRLLKSQPRGHFRRCLPGTNPAFGPSIRLDHFKD
jgi:hypothetical protein